ncbi:MAG: MFS transporter [Syntrophomonadaceae bacterium]|nr:MFS transporter [Syntrophomonadaceae bacterium]
MKWELKWQVLGIICAGIFISTLDGSILNIANPLIAADFSVSMKEVQWVSISYMLVITATLLFFGKYGDGIGSQKVYAYGFLVFTGGSLLCSLSPSLSYLVASRIFQAFGASMMMATGAGIISNSFPPEEKGKALGLTSSMVGIGNMAGPVVGGLILARWGWPFIFLVNVPIGLLGFYLAIKHLPLQPRSMDKRSYDMVGMILFALGSVTLLISLSHNNPSTPVIALAAISLLIGFCYYEKRQIYPMLDFALFKIKTFLYGNIMSFLAYISQIWVMFLLPFYLEEFLQMAPHIMGLYMTIPPVCLAITAPLAGSLSDRIGSGRLTSVGLFLMTLSQLSFSMLASGSSMVKIAVGLMLIGIGMGFFASPNSSSIFRSVPAEKAGYTGGFTATTRNFSISLGTAVSASIFTYVLAWQQQLFTPDTAYLSTMGIVFKISAVISLGALLLSIFTAQARTAETNQLSR